MNKKIWNTNGKKQSNEVAAFLAGEDIELDKSIFIYDIQASIAHVNNLFSIGIIKKGESTKIIKSLKDLKKKFQEGSFKLTNKYEDCHSAIEFYLTKELGELGKKVHTGRSRNDQVIVAMRLFAKQNLINFKIENKLVAKTFLKLAKKHENHQMPGYTHLQRAMPSSWGLWFSSYAESFIDNIDLINSTIDWIDSNPLGSAAGYGVSLPLNRKQVTKELGFKRIQLNSLYVQNSRGKYEMQILNTLKQSMLDIRKFSWDMSLFLSQEFDLVEIDSIYQTGSSIMPNKHNPDVIEILRANSTTLSVGDLYSSRTAVSVGGSNTTIDSFAAADYRSAKYTIRVSDSTGYQSIEVLLVHDGVTPIMTVYGSISTTGADLISLTTVLSGSNILLRATPVNSSTSVNLLGTYVPD